MCGGSIPPGAVSAAPANARFQCLRSWRAANGLLTDQARVELARDALEPFGCQVGVYAERCRGAGVAGDLLGYDHVGALRHEP